LTSTGAASRRAGRPPSNPCTNSPSIRRREQGLVPIPGLDISVDARERRLLVLGADEGSRREPLQVRVEGAG
jgi:hypothetical protein